MLVDGILEIAVYCDDLEAAEAFYGRVVGLERIARDPRRHVFFRCGSGVLLVFDPDATSGPPARVGGGIVPSHGARGAGHLAFRIATNALEDCRARLAAHGVPVESEVAWPGGGRSIYVRDPAGNSIEFATPEVWK